MIHSLKKALILTPTARLARAEKQHRSRARTEAGETAWRAPEVRAISSWLGALGNTALLDGVSEQVPIGGAQARLLWQQVIDTDVFVGEPRVHALCERAWRAIHEYRLPRPHDWPELLISEDSRRFRDWAARFEQLCDARGVIDEWALAARLPERIADGRIELPERIELIGFERPPTPLIEAVFDALQGVGVELSGRPETFAPTLPSALDLQEFVDPADELAAAARWARARTEADPDASIAVVVPDLAGRLARVERVFRRVFDPSGFALEASTPQAWHVSLGRALSDWPLAADALLLLRLEPGRIRQAEAGRLLNSPYLRQAEPEAAARATAQTQLMNKAPFEVTAFELAAACSISGARGLARGIEQWQERRNNHRDRVWPSDWVGRFQIELEALGFGRGRALDSIEWQVLARWHRLLEDFAMLDAVQNAPIARAEALRLLAERARANTFRERNPGCPVEILGVEEALGSRFDALWITTLDSAHWPGAARRDPLIPGPIQAAIPQASGDGQLQQARLDLAGLLRAGASVALSYARGSDNAPLEPTRLLPDARVVSREPEPLPEPVPTEIVVDDARAPAFAQADSRGGIGVLRDQSACSFRAFAQHRLGARALESPLPGLSAAARGSLRHWALETFWRGLRDRNALLALTETELGQRIVDAADQALGRLVQSYRRTLSRAALALEQASLVRTLERWLALERERGDFRIRALEQKIELDFAGLKLRGTIDRIDQTEAGLLLIDYKTGATGRGDWKPDPRIKDPQLPAYALASDPAPAGIAFGRLKPDDLRFDGAAGDELDVPGISVVGDDRGQWKVAENWDALLAAWRENLDGLARAFVAGEASVDPRKPDVCTYCHLHALCRIDERRVGIDAEEDAA
jgi:probable DNA repair protein